MFASSCSQKVRGFFRTQGSKLLGIGLIIKNYIYLLVDERSTVKVDESRTLWAAVVIPMFDNDMTINQRTGMMTFMTLQYAAEMINRDEDMFNYTVRLRRVFPTSPIFADFESLVYIDKCLDTDVAFVFGPTYDVNFDTMISLTTIQPTVHIAQASSSEEYDINIRLDEIERGQKTIKTGFQTNPSGLFQIMAARDTILKFGWNYVYWILTESMFVDRTIFRSEKICVEGTFTIPLPRDRFDGNYDIVRDEIAEIHRKYPKLRVLLMGTTAPDSRHVLRAIKELGLKEHFILFFIGKGVNNIEVVKGNILIIY